MFQLSDREARTEIVEACRAGDRVAFRELYDVYKDRVYSIALYFFHGDRIAASDVTQQVFLKVLVNIGQFRGEAVFSTWLYRLVVNVSFVTSLWKWLQRGFDLDWSDGAREVSAITFLL